MKRCVRFRVNVAMRCAITWIALGAGQVAGQSTSQVIAAPPAIDQSDEVISPDQPILEGAIDAAVTPDESTLNLLDVVLIAVAGGLVFLIVRRRWYVLDRTQRGALGMQPVAGLVLLAGFVVLAPLGAGAAAKAWGIDVSDMEALTLREHVIMVCGAYAAQMIVIAAYMWLNRPPSRVRAVMPTAKALAIGVAAFAVVWPIVVVAALLMAMVMRIVTGESVEPIAHDTLQMLVDRPVDGWSLAMMAMVLIAAPVVEEVIYRGILQRVLIAGGLGRWLAIVCTSAAFVVMHARVADVHGLAALFVLSLAFGWALERTGRLMTPIVMHVMFNGANLALAMSGAV